MSERSPAQQALDLRFGPGSEAAPAPWDSHDVVAPGLAARGSVRRFTDAPVELGMLRALAAAALCAPSKSDVQGRDIILIDSEEIRAEIAGLLTSGPLAQEWVAACPRLVVFCANNRRQRLWHEWHDIPFANDHLDAFFNAAIEAGIALSAFVLAAEAAGLATCPISAIRNHSARVSELLGLPDHVFPVAGLGVGWPAAPPRVAMRLPLDVTVHTDRYDESGLEAKIAAYDARRREAQPMGRQRDVARFGESPTYGWSEDKARQYASPERADFGAFIRAKGFNLT